MGCKPGRTRGNHAAYGADMMRPIYAGVGSRAAPRTLESLMRKTADRLEARGWVLHSGGAPRSDQWFESGVRNRAENARIFLPWKLAFRGHPSPLHTVCERALTIARHYHPTWHRLDQGGRLLMGRNSYQVLGPTLDEPVACVVCWTEDGKASGGTGQAIRIADDHDVPVFNLHDPTALDRLGEFVRGFG
jgi:hypothetical protein